MLSESGTRLWKEQHSGKISFLVDRPLSGKGHKMLIGLLARRWCKSSRLVYTARYAERKPGLEKSQGCWHCITLYYPLISMYNQKYKKLSQTIKDGPVFQTSFSNWFLGNLAPPHVNSLSLSFSLSLPLLFRLIPWYAEAHWVYLLALASKTHTRGSPRWGTLHYSSGHRWPNVDCASFLSWNFIAFPHKSSYSASFLHQFSYYTILS